MDRCGAGRFEPNARARDSYNESDVGHVARIGAGVRLVPWDCTC